MVLTKKIVHSVCFNGEIGLPVTVRSKTNILNNKCHQKLSLKNC